MSGSSVSCFRPLQIKSFELLLRRELKATILTGGSLLAIEPATGGEHAVEQGACSLLP